MSEMTVGCIRTTLTPPPAGIMEVLLEKAERERDDALGRLKDCGSHMMQVCKELEAGEMDCAIDAAIMAMGRIKRAEKESAELADRLSGLELSATQKLAQLEQERNEAIQERERWKMQAEQKWGMRRELEELLGVGDTESEEQFAKGVAALRDLIQERDEAREALSEWEDAVKHVEADHPDEVHCGCVPVLRKLLNDAQKENERLKNFADNIHAELLEAREESLEQARLLGKGGSREARLITERDHYKQAIEEIATTIQEYKDSIVQEPAEDFIWAIKAWADKKLKEI